MTNAMKALWRDESGQSMSEYALIIAVVVVALVATLVIFRGKIGAVFNGISFSS